ncbi:MAG: hypothetical protein LC667_06125 [Thioalkalivibrio sp.]|nr:hypothetical protein [Thioalkalivibrio sp.]
MQTHEKRVLGLSLVVTLLGGWVTVGAAEPRRVPASEDFIYVIGNGSCPWGPGQYLRCNEFPAPNCLWTPTSCTNAGGENGGYTLVCKAGEIGPE